MIRFLVVSLVLAASTSALAASEPEDALTEMRELELPEIAETGITAFDSVFMKAKAIHDTLDGVAGRIIGVQDKVAAAIGLPEGTPIRMTMWELKQRAGGPIAVAMRDNKPYLTVGGTGSDEVKAMIAAVNTGVADLAGIPGELAKLPPQVQQLVAACQAFPGQLNPQLIQEAGMSPLQLPKVVKTVGSNVKAVVATPKRLELLGKAVQDLLTGIPQGLAATEAPMEAVTVADAKGGGKEKAAKAAKSSGASESEYESGSEEEYSAGVADDLPPSAVGAMVSDAFDAFRDAEIESAVQLLAEADQSLMRAGTPISSGELEDLYETAALVHLVDGNAAAATASAVQALIVDPESKPSSALGPEYAKLHKALQKSGVITIVPVDITGVGSGYLSGRAIEAGTRIELATGKHLLQRQVNGKWVSELVWVSEGSSIDI